MHIKLKEQKAACGVIPESWRTITIPPLHDHYYHEGPETMWSVNDNRLGWEKLSSAFRVSQWMAWDWHLKLYYDLISPTVGICTGICVYSRELQIINLVWLWKLLQRMYLWSDLKKMLGFHQSERKKLWQLYNMSLAKALMLSNCDTEDSRVPRTVGRSTSQSYRKSSLSIHWKD